MMKTITILILFHILSSNLFSRNVRLIWDAPPEGEYVNYYYVFVSREPRILRMEHENPWFYEQLYYSAIPFYMVLGLDDNITYYFVVAAVDHVGNISYPSKEVKITPNRNITNAISFTPPNLLNYSVYGDSGKYIAIEYSTDLVNWVWLKNDIIDSNDVVMNIFTLSTPNRFYRAVPITVYNYQKYDPKMFDVFYYTLPKPPQPEPIINTTPKDPVNKRPDKKRKVIKKHESFWDKFRRRFFK
jgi:hypothetical protein